MTGIYGIIVKSVVGTKYLAVCVVAMINSVFSYGIMSGGHGKSRCLS